MIFVPLDRSVGFGASVSNGWGFELCVPNGRFSALCATTGGACPFKNPWCGWNCGDPWLSGSSGWICPSFDSISGPPDADLL
ncbi:hypothetical protein R1sor_021750 [Riccia sorocarpa]|uniref:Uncharacterized protein n=1 Tax=Riccia sorocarpa TaxID=122646 RepID=A0ABD3GK28_9MARC